MTPLHIIIHISDSPGGTIEETDKWHDLAAYVDDADCTVKGCNLDEDAEWCPPEPVCQ